MVNADIAPIRLVFLVLRTIAFKYEKEKVLVSAARTEWVMKHGLKCEITIPAKYKYEMKKIQTGWEHRIPYTIPAVYTTVSRQELVTPASESWMQVKQGCGSCGHGGYAATTRRPATGNQRSAVARSTE